MYLATKKNLLDDETPQAKPGLSCFVPSELASCRILRPLSHELQRITKAPTGQEVEVTSKERTLIDIAIRPAYSGGVAQILEAYKRARSQASVQKMLKLLGTFD